MKLLLSAGVGALALGLVASSAQAAPAGANLAAGVERSVDEGGLVQQVRRRHRDRYHRRYYRHRYYRDRNYYYYDDDDYYYYNYYYRFPYYWRYYRYRRW
jgi:hypothetical protein